MSWKLMFMLFFQCFYFMTEIITEGLSCFIVLLAHKWMHDEWINNLEHIYLLTQLWNWYIKYEKYQIDLMISLYDTFNKKFDVHKNQKRFKISKTDIWGIIWRCNSLFFFKYFWTSPINFYHFLMKKSNLLKSNFFPSELLFILSLKIWLPSYSLILLNILINWLTSELSILADYALIFFLSKMIDICFHNWFIFLEKCLMRWLMLCIL